MPTTAAIQKTAVGGGFIATGTVTMVAGTVAGGALAIQGNVPPETIIVAAGVPVFVGAIELILGGMLLQRGGEELDAAQAKPLQRKTAQKPAPAKPKPVTTKPAPAKPKPVPDVVDDEDDEG